MDRRQPGHGHHQVGSGEGQLFAEGAGWMVDGEVLGGDAAALHPDRRQGIPDRHRYGGAGGGGEVERAYLPVHRAVEHHVAAARQARLHPAHQGDAGRAAALQVGQDLQQFLGLAAVGEQQGDVVGGHHAQVAVQGVEGIEVDGHQANRGEGGGDLAGDDAALAHAGDHQLGPPVGAGLQQLQGPFHLSRVQSLGAGRDRGRLLDQAAGEGRQGASPG